jgi:hypothetical protein
VYIAVALKEKELEYADVLSDPQKRVAALRYWFKKIGGVLLIHSADAPTEALKLLEDWHLWLLNQLQPGNGQPHQLTSGEFEGLDLADAIEKYLKKSGRQRVKVKDELVQILLDGNAGPSRNPLRQRDPSNQWRHIQAAITQNSPGYKRERKKPPRFVYDEETDTVSLLAS